MPFVESRGTRIHFEVEGDGPTVVLHTGAGGDLAIWRLGGYLERLRGFRKILIDQRGRGQSDRPKEIEAYRMERFVEDLAAVLDSVGADSVGFWGYSNGMNVGIAFGAAWPLRLRCLVGTGTLRYRDRSDLPPPADVNTEIRQDVANGGVVAELEARMVAESDRFPPEIDANVRAGDPLTYALTGAAWSSWKGPRSAVARFRAPVLILTGEKEDPHRFTEETVARTPGARMVRVPGVGHLGAFYRSDLAVPLVRPFLQESLG